MCTFGGITDQYPDRMEKINFINGTTDNIYISLGVFLRKNGHYTYEDCILALRKEAVYVEENCKTSRELKALRVNDGRFLPPKLRNSFTKQQQAGFRVHSCQVKHKYDVSELNAQPYSIPDR